MVADNPAATVIWRATVVMIVAWMAGNIVGAVAQRVVNRNIEAYKAAHPLPVEGSADETGGQGSESDSESQIESADQGQRLSAGANVAV